MRKHCEALCPDALFLGLPSVSPRTGEGPVTVTSWPWPTPVCHGTYHPAAHQEENSLSDGMKQPCSTTPPTHTHMLPIIPRVLHCCSSVSIKQVGRKDKRACSAYSMKVHTEQIPICSPYLFEGKLTECACGFAHTNTRIHTHTHTLHSASV